MKRLLIGLTMLTGVGCNAFHPDMEGLQRAQYMQLVVDPAFDEGERTEIFAAVDTWNAAVPELGLQARMAIDGERANVVLMLGPGDPGEGGGVVLGYGSPYGIQLWVDEIDKGGLMHEVMLHEVTHYLGADHHDEGACTSPWVTDCIGGLSELDIEWTVSAWKELGWAK